MPLFDGIDTTIAGLAKFAGAAPPKAPTEGLDGRSRFAVAAPQKAFDTVNDEATLKPLIDGLFARPRAAAQLRGWPIDDAGKFEIDFRLRQKEARVPAGGLLANGVKIDALADDGVVVPASR